MFLHKGKESFSAVNITAEEMALLFDSMSNYLTQISHLLRLSNNEFLKAHGIKNQNKGQKLREIYEKRIPQLKEQIANFSKYVSQ
jgi:hypothetical protein